MDDNKRAIIKKRFNDIESLSDFVALLKFCSQISDPEQFYPIDSEKIIAFSNKDNEKRYHRFFIKKKRKGYRRIHSPVEELKFILRSLNLILKSVYDVNSAAYGFVDGKNVVDNAKVHIGKNYVFNLDLEDFFLSIEADRIFERLKLPPFNLIGNKAEIADIITNLITDKLYFQEQNKKDTYEVKYVLPQGAPSSPIVSNIICEELDKELLNIAKKFV